MTTYTDRAGKTAREIEMELKDWLQGGLNRSDGRLALFDRFGEPVDKAVIKTAIKQGLAEPWFSSPMRPQWMVCRITPKGRESLSRVSRTTG